MGKLFFHHLMDLYVDESEAGSASHILNVNQQSAFEKQLLTWLKMVHGPKMNLKKPKAW
jgi:hypothetical protein